MENKNRWLGTLAVVVVVIAAVGSIGAFTYGSHSGPSGYGMMGGMHGSWGWGRSTSGVPISNEEAARAAQDYIAAYGGTPLELAEVMVFDNHFYAEARETETGRYAYEFLIDRFSGRISLEPGPNMMWNEKYGHMGGRMMGFFRPLVSSDPMPVDENEAIEAAQAYLDRYVPGLQVNGHADAFYGYYTLHTLRNGEIVGMLSVNGYTGAVWLHSWHGVYLGGLGEETH